MLFKKIEARRTNAGKGLFAAERIKKGSTILEILGKRITEEESGEWDLQIEENTFIRSPKIAPDNYLNHSCDPNAFMKKIGRNFSLVALKSIKKDEEIMFDYDTTDYDNKAIQKKHFPECLCGAKNCRKVIRGFKYLNDRQKAQLEKFLLPYLKKIYSKEKKILEK